MNQSLIWPLGTGARGTAPLAERVAATPGAIGFVEGEGVAARLGQPIVLLRTAAGRFVAPSAAHISQALASRSWDAASHGSEHSAEPSARDNDRMAVTVFALMRARHAPHPPRAAVLPGRTDRTRP